MPSICLRKKWSLIAAYQLKYQNTWKNNMAILAIFTGDGVTKQMYE
jgi:hypothetical protein